MASVTLQNLRKRFKNQEVLRGIDLQIRDGEFLVLVGPSGCGKSTLLRMIAGLDSTSEGCIKIGERNVSHVTPAQREIAMVFQSYALYPHMTVWDNMAFGLKMAGIPKEEQVLRIQQAVDILQLHPYIHRKPAELSGGQRQRVAIGRAIVRQPEVFLFDEPLSNLDAKLRDQMRVQLMELHQRLGTTMIYVTHDQKEAMTMADRIVVMRQGVIEQMGTPLELYERPANRFVAGFIGSPTMNFVPVKMKHQNNGESVVTLPWSQDIRLGTWSASVNKDERLELGIRPQGVLLDDSSPYRMQVDVTEPLGNMVYVHGRINGVRLVVETQKAPNPGSQVGIHLNDAMCHLFDGEGQCLRQAMEHIHAA
ncbi:ABC transporter ATP-binding protein [Hahella sp. CCB-MM4]|uniref:ABC transporter ATP-binding protein n=1 Tax=Hahella sp. (strain CCB-MM4) TaxID=1926491 RepID=UPI000B9C6CFB|nr:sn-glycerol-3-phosphate ABC transporter ATP-binding protein UgpC [Hahella sp. CCB-MM4]OZG75248.1 ABC transporter ATP-binding protein [Hahella sp. CCB-MM4]